MRLPLALFVWCVTSAIAASEPAPTLPDGQTLSQPPFTRLDSRVPGVKFRCVLYEELVGDQLYFWEVCRLRSNGRKVKITMWAQHEVPLTIWESKEYFPK